tara:strand:- start:396 stop:602 length:207 start_codon:yes stop_codon:yes gene_type:complete
MAVAGLKELQTSYQFPMDFEQLDLSSNCHVQYGHQGSTISDLRTHVCSSIVVGWQQSLHFELVVEGGR